ncbi:4-(cytidine 5'-diphospho)-2-C-methyl-D-erythritol kinase [Campylobacter pinnipediorum]|uniref:4-(cytidine 5'-diphospho)-2-C-methyl-D-erythritol kinase n=1 Tax=Campylobacter pinnipediorum TaxID=1965231 RepID=UPI00084DF28C|nr:4-(cytidine 5'-diphospho)-2-C-methyl-D-erythritol kinase [Campylobacter pinnipediorum]AQW82573.1 4-diphosphocytidyl-2-C-methylerythritol kinase [Campylobacter pinnipediorum subsp. pinnipediorum]
MKSFAKLNIFLKIVGTRGNYHEINSRFILLNDIYDEIYFKLSDKFYIESNYDIDDNIVLRAKEELEKAGYKNELDEYFKNHKIVLKKNIPMGSGMGGGSSNAATFLKLANEELNLNIKTEKLAEIASKIGSDVPFFVYNYPSANVSGIGENVIYFDDEIPQIDLIMPNISCETPRVYREFRDKFMQNIDIKQADNFMNKKSNELLCMYKNYELNDLFLPCLSLYSKMKDFDNKFLSGSGSTMFGLKGVK